MSGTAAEVLPGDAWRIILNAVAAAYWSVAHSVLPDGFRCLLHGTALLHRCPCCCGFISTAAEAAAPGALVFSYAFVYLSNKNGECLLLCRLEYTQNALTWLELRKKHFTINSASSNKRILVMGSHGHAPSTAKTPYRKHALAVCHRYAETRSHASRHTYLRWIPS